LWQPLHESLVLEHARVSAHVQETFHAHNQTLLDGDPFRHPGTLDIRDGRDECQDGAGFIAVHQQAPAFDAP